MRKFIIKIVLPVFVTTALLLVLGEIGLRSLSTDAKIQSEYMDNNASHLKILVLGSSSTADGIKPAFLDIQPAFSCALGAQNSKEDYWIFTRYYDKMDSLQYLILNYAPGIFSKVKNKNEEEIMGIGNPNREKKYRIYYDCPYYNTIEHQFEISGGVADKLRTLVISFINHNPEPFLKIDKEDGFTRNEFVPIPYNEQAWRIAGKRAAKGFSFSGKLEKNDEYIDMLEEILAKCDKKGVRVIMVGCPIHRFNYEELDQRRLDFDNDMLKELTTEHANFKFINRMKDSTFTEKDMYNVNHLNPTGAERFTKIVNDSIQAWKQ